MGIRITEEHRKNCKRASIGGGSGDIRKSGMLPHKGEGRSSIKDAYEPSKTKRFLPFLGIFFNSNGYETFAEFVSPIGCYVR